MVGPALRPAVIGALARAPERFSFSRPSPEDDPALGASVARFGLLRPLLAEAAGEGLLLLAGHRRLALAEALGWREVPVGVVAPPDPAARWDLLLEDHLGARPLNPVELGRYAALRQADTGESSDELARRVLPRLGLAPRAALLEDPRWLAGLSPRHQDAFAAGRLPVQGVRVLRRAAPEDAAAVLDLLAPLAPGVNRFTELARLLLECAWAEGQAVAAWAAGADLGDAASAEALLADLRRRRYPTVAAWSDAFDGDVAAAGLPPGVRVSHAPGFEGGKLTLTAPFGSLAALEETVASVLAGLRAGRLAPLGRYLG